MDVTEEEEAAAASEERSAGRTIALMNVNLFEFVS